MKRMPISGAFTVSASLGLREDFCVVFSFEATKLQNLTDKKVQKCDVNMHWEVFLFLFY